jgi:8-oxo-dGTP diphosphatase
MERIGKRMVSNESIKKEILADLSSIIPFDPIEKEHLEFVKAWIASGAEIFRIAKPDNPNIHLVSYFIVVDPHTNEILLVDHKKAGLWLPSGGHVELNEHPQETVRREIREELGIEADFLLESPLFLTVTKTVGNVKQHTDISLWYVLKGNRSQPLQFDSDEFHQIQWFQLDQIPYERTDPHMKRFVDKVIKKITTLNSYDVSSSQYEKNTADLHPKEEAHRFMKKLPSQAKIIDIGCGPGRDAKVFSDHGFNVIGIDFSSKMIEAAKQNAPLASFYVMDIENLVFPAASFDGAWANCALLHLSKRNILSVLEKIHASLKPTGSFYLSAKKSSIGESFESDSRYEELKKHWFFLNRMNLSICFS